MSTIYLCPNCGSLQAGNALVPWHSTGYTPYDHIFGVPKLDKSKNIFDFSEK